MFNIIHKITDFSSSKKGAKLVVLFWIILAVVLSGVTEGAKAYKTGLNTTGLPDDAKSVIASEKVDQYFKEDTGVPALLVFYKEEGLTNEDVKKISSISKTIEDEKLDTVKEVVPVYNLPPQALGQFMSENKKAMILPVILKDELERSVMRDTVKEMNGLVKDELGKNSDITFKTTGPAGIVSDMLSLFASADIVLLLSTVVLIFVLLIIIYRSPILALVPLIAAGIINQVVGQTLGFFGKAGMLIESQSLSIMSILLFAVITDYSLFIVSRFKEELVKEENKFVAMKRAMREVSEVIFFSGSTVLAAMLILFAAIYVPYQNFAPIFSVALVIILLAGLTLLPALFVLFGRKSFWPAIPKVGDKKLEKKGFWDKFAAGVTKHPVTSGLVIVVLLVVFSLNVFNIHYSFNLIKSFPEDMESRVGYELLEENYSPGDLAPTKVIIESNEALTIDQIKHVQQELEKQDGVAEVTPAFSNPMEEARFKEESMRNNDQIAKIELTFEKNPYDLETLAQLNKIRDNEKDIIKKAGLADASLHFAGETATQADTKAASDRDTMVVAILITVLITLLLGFQTKSLIAPIYMMITILFSFFAALGISSFIFDKGFGLDAISYRIPLYSFIFLVALGVDYNIMLISRIKEEVKTHPINEAIEIGLAKTGGVISSAGLILAATFAVLITQPIMELYMFGATVAIGILIDTFLVRTVLVPSIMMKLGKWSLWPQKLEVSKEKVEK